MKSMESIVLEAELNFYNALDINEQSPIVQKNEFPPFKDQIKMYDHINDNIGPKEEMVIKVINK